jgi:integrase
MGMHLTDKLVKGLPVPAKGNSICYDLDVPGFGVRVTAGGARAFVLTYRTRAGQQRRYTIGGFPDWKTTAARDHARRLKQDIDRGADPMADIEAQREAPTMADLADRFESDYLPTRRASTAADYKRILKNHIRPHFGKSAKVADVTHDDVVKLHRKVTAAGHTYRANAVVRVLSRMFSLAVRWGCRADNPCKGLEKNHEAKRHRYLKPDELARLTKALVDHPDQQAANIVRLLLLTGARRGEVLGMKWSGLDLQQGTWTKLASETKQNREHEIPLSAPARQLLAKIRAEQESKARKDKAELPTYVFDGRNDSHRTKITKDWAALCKAAEISNLRIHDLRHSYASELVSAGMSLPVIGALLGHSNPATTARYAHLFDDPLREATERVGAAIVAAGQPAANLARLRGRR